VPAIERGVGSSIWCSMFIMAIIARYLFPGRPA
jgi:hypothetical protein